MSPPRTTKSDGDGKKKRKGSKRDASSITVATASTTNGSSSPACAKEPAAATTATTTSDSKRAKITPSQQDSTATTTTTTPSSSSPQSSYKPPLTLPAIQDRIQQLLSQVPSAADTAALQPTLIPELETWCRRVRTIVRQFNLVLNFCRPATYQWAPDRSGHTNQNLATLSSEISCAASSLGIISGDVKLVLTPNLDKQLQETTKVQTDDRTRVETYKYVHVIDDPEMLQLHRQQLCEEALDKRELLIVVMQKMHQCIGDFLKADDNSNDRMNMSY